jgi:hypothetical protein
MPGIDANESSTAAPFDSHTREPDLKMVQSRDQNRN